jgi:3-polyprenyl-4-hydroxybenzoate decarboxylase
MKIHPRERISNVSGAEIVMAVHGIWDKHDPTYATILAALSSVQDYYIREMAKAETATTVVPSTTAGVDTSLPGDATSMAMEIRAVINQHELTNGEILRCLNEQMASMIKYVIREERHPGQPDLPGGLE